ncbi:unnamed protein product, partial [Polarella glacialis]
MELVRPLAREALTSPHLAEWQRLDGKTRIMKELALKTTGKVLVLVPSHVLLGQFAEAFPAFCCVGMGHNDGINWDARGFLAVYDSAHLLANVSFCDMYVDEAHHPLPPGCPGALNIYKFSATHYIQPHFEYTMAQAIEEEVLCDYDVVIRIVTEGDVQVCLADMILKRAGHFRHILAYCNSIDEAKRFQIISQKVGLAAWHINGDTPPKVREMAIKDFPGSHLKPAHVLVTVQGKRVSPRAHTQLAGGELERFVSALPNADERLQESLREGRNGRIRFIDARLDFQAGSSPMPVIKRVQAQLFRMSRNMDQWDEMTSTHPKVASHLRKQFEPLAAFSDKCSELKVFVQENGRCPRAGLGDPYERILGRWLLRQSRRFPEMNDDERQLLQKSHLQVAERVAKCEELSNFMQEFDRFPRLAMSSWLSKLTDGRRVYHPADSLPVGERFCLKLALLRSFTAHVMASSCCPCKWLEHDKIGSTSGIGSLGELDNFAEKKSASRFAQGVALAQGQEVDDVMDKVGLGELTKRPVRTVHNSVPRAPPTLKGVFERLYQDAVERVQRYGLVRDQMLLANEAYAAVIGAVSSNNKGEPGSGTVEVPDFERLILVAPM